jgi:hypothetical protein
MLALLSASVDGVLKLWTFKSADVLENVFASPPAAEVRGVYAGTSLCTSLFSLSFKFSLAHSLTLSPRLSLSCCLCPGRPPWTARVNTTQSTIV